MSSVRFFLALEHPAVPSLLCVSEDMRLSSTRIDLVGVNNVERRSFRAEDLEAHFIDLPRYSFEAAGKPPNLLRIVSGDLAIFRKNFHG